MYVYSPTSYANTYANKPITITVNRAVINDNILKNVFITQIYEIYLNKKASILNIDAFFYL